MKFTQCHINTPLSGGAMSLRGKLCVAFLLTLIFTIYFLFSFYVPYIGDDYSLQVDWMMANGGELGFSWESLWKFAVHLRNIDNARLDNIIYTAMSIALPKWTLAIVAGVSASMMMWFASRLIYSVKAALPYVIIAFWAWCVFSFPWRNCAMGVDNSFNVLLPSALTLAFILMMKSVDGSSRVSLLEAVGMCFFALIAGWIHEGYSVPVCCGLGMWCIVRRFRLPKLWWMLALCYALAAVYVLSSPGIWLRLTYEPEVSKAAVNVKTLLSFTISVIAVLVVVAVVAIIAIRKIGLRGLFGWFMANQMRIVIFTIFMASLFVVMMTSIDNPRAMWICALFGSIFMFQVISPVFLWPRKVLVSLAWTAIVLVTVFYVNVLRVQKNIYDEECEIRQLMSVSEYGTVYRAYDISLPKTTLLHPVNAHWRNSLHVTNYDKAMADGKLYAVVPECLVSLTDEMVDFIDGVDGVSKSSSSSDNWPQLVPGSAGLYYYGDALLRQDEELTNASWFDDAMDVYTKDVAYDYVCTDGRRFDGMASTKIRFRTRTGRPLIYIAPGHVKVTGPYESISITE